MFVGAAEGTIVFRSRCGSDLMVNGVVIPGSDGRPGAGLPTGPSS
ncbi:hypothetical protein [Geodermatophilus sp. Leaf369]|nr:hypothetical protein [Geodermatophilus sp. Leaf369]